MSWVRASYIEGQSENGRFGDKVGGSGKGLLTYVVLMKMYSFELGWEECILWFHDSNAAHGFPESSEDSESQTALCFSKSPRDLKEVVERVCLGSYDRKYSTSHILNAEPDVQTAPKVPY